MKNYGTQRLSKDELVHAKKIGKLLEDGDPSLGHSDRLLREATKNIINFGGGSPIGKDRFGEETLDLEDFEEEAEEEVYQLKSGKKDKKSFFKKKAEEEEEAEESVDLKKVISPKTKDFKELKKDLAGSYMMNARGGRKGRGKDDGKEAAGKMLGKMMIGGALMIPGANVVGGMNKMVLNKTPAKVDTKEFTPEERTAIKKQTVANVMKESKALGGGPMEGIGGEGGSGIGDIFKGLSGGKAALLGLVGKAESGMQGLLAAASAKFGALIFPFVCITLIFAIVFFNFHGISSSILEGYATVRGELRESYISPDVIEDMILERGYRLDEEGNKVSTLPEEQQQLLRFLFSTVGCGYSQAWNKRQGPDSYDCSGLAYVSEHSIGKNVPDDCAAGEAYGLFQDGKIIEDVTTDLEIGDLIFYGGHDNGRYLGIYHVAIYVGNGHVVEAYNSKRGVIYGPVRTKNAIMIGRP
ncbi:C40 family peptidase [Pseudobutyrivibrio sp.]|uniref:C40 family peptidase n=1 Tax=Pseudobutyrivibrio sp. TaxID=2014367 RepID=UPI0025F37A5E|nr:NlpC/P60 family protein [Pseudobutyrivibrio sp.]MBR5650294.1 C40 family peptidase [Pseudobutyrivibrio sp.]